MTGCDRLALRVHIDPDQVTIQYPSRGTQNFYFDEHGGRLESKLHFNDTAAIHVRFNLATERMRVEFNPSTILGHNLCPFDQLPRALDRVLRHVHAELGIDTQPNDAERAVVQRVDVTRDFATDDARQLIQLLTPLKRAYATRLELHYDPTKLLVSGVVAGNKESHVKLYVREGHLLNYPDRDWLRFEVQARGDWLKYLREDVPGRSKPFTFKELTSAACHRLLADRWAWSKFGTSYTADDGWWRLVLDELGQRKARALAGYMYGLVHQVDLGYQDHTNHEHLDRLGLPASSGLLPTTRASTMRLRLDRDTPRTVLRRRRL